MSVGTVRTVSSRALVDACAKLGVDTDTLLKTAGLERGLLQDPDARIPVAKVAELWQHAYALARDPHLALHAAEALPFGAYKVIDYMAASAATVGVAFHKVSEYFPLINTAVRLPIHEGRDEVTFGLESVPGSPAISLPYAEYVFAACYLRVRDAVGEFEPLRVEFTPGPPADSREHERIFRAPARFGCERNRLVFSQQVWRQRSTHPNLDLCGVLEEHAKRLLAELPADGLVGEIQKLTSEQLRGGTPTLEHVAKLASMSGRTLQRRLREEGTSFAELLDALRRGMAQTYLADAQIAISEVSYLLGFSEQSAFNRAFKRWTGATPLEFRRNTAKPAR